MADLAAFKPRDLSRIRAAELVPLQHLTSDFPERMKEVVCCLYVALLDYMRAAGRVEESALAELAVVQLKYVAKELGGGNFYLHKRDIFERAERDRRIVCDFDGTNAAELAIRHKLTEVRVLQILKAHRRRTKPPVQGGRPT